MNHILKSMLTATAAVAFLASGAIAEDAPRKGGTLMIGPHSPISPKAGT